MTDISCKSTFLSRYFKILDNVSVSVIAFLSHTFSNFSRSRCFRISGILAAFHAGMVYYSVRIRIFYYLSPQPKILPKRLDVYRSFSIDILSRSSSLYLRGCFNNRSPRWIPIHRSIFYQKRSIKNCNVYVVINIVGHEGLQVP